MYVLLTLPFVFVDLDHCTEGEFYTAVVAESAFTSAFSDMADSFFKELQAKKLAKKRKPGKRKGKC